MTTCLCFSNTGKGRDATCSLFPHPRHDKAVHNVQNSTRYAGDYKLILQHLVLSKTYVIVLLAVSIRFIFNTSNNEFDDNFISVKWYYIVTPIPLKWLPPYQFQTIVGVNLSLTLGGVGSKLKLQNTRSLDELYNKISSVICPSRFSSLSQ